MKIGKHDCKFFHEIMMVYTKGYAEHETRKRNPTFSSVLGNYRGIFSMHHHCWSWQLIYALAIAKRNKCITTAQNSLFFF